MEHQHSAFRKDDASWLTDKEGERMRIPMLQRYFTEALGGLLPKSLPLSEVKNVLDVGCGEGTWVVDMLKQYPHMRVTGIDISESAVRDARLQAQQRGIQGATFLRMDITQPLTVFKQNTFDLVHMSSAATFLHPAQWPMVIAELVRIVRPGGWLNVIEYEQGPTSSDALNQISALQADALRKAGLSAAPVSPTMGIAVRLYRFLLNAYLLDVSYKIFAVDLGSGNRKSVREFVEEMLTGFSTFKPYLVELGLTDARSFDELVRQARVELTRPDACGYGYLISAYGCKDG